MFEKYVLIEEERVIENSGSKEKLAKDAVSYMLRENLFWVNPEFSADKKFKTSAGLMSYYDKKAKGFKEPTLYDVAKELADSYKEEAISAAKRLIMESLNKNNSFRISFSATALILEIPG